MIDVTSCISRHQTNLNAFIHYLNILEYAQPYFQSFQVWKFPRRTPLDPEFSCSIPSGFRKGSVGESRPNRYRREMATPAIEERTVLLVEGRATYIPAPHHR